MKQGTRSVLFGCHSPIHSTLVAIAWRRIYGVWPRPWELACIFLHDVGHWGKNYLDNIDEKRQHWRLGADIAGKLFGQKGYDLVAGHDPYSGYPRSRLHDPDKFSYMLAPQLWLWCNLVVEPKMRTTKHISRWQHAKRFKREAIRNVKSGAYRSGHDLYLEQKEWAEKEKPPETGG